MSRKLVILCPGQGAQAIGMGRAWAQSNEAAADVFRAADAKLGERFGKPLSAICWDGPEELLNRTDVAQPALYVAGVACWRALFGDDARRDLVAAAGLSLGEYTALHIAGAISFEDGLNLVTLRGRAMQDAAEAVASGMVALIGADPAQAGAVCEQAAKGEVLVPANFNAPGQVVISGAIAACDRAVEVAAGMGLRASKLAVAGAFHSPLMAPAANRLAKALSEVNISTPACPTLSNVTGRPHESASGESAAEAIRRRLVEQLTRPVQWSDGCQWLVANTPGEFHELAPGKVLSGLMRRIDRNAKVVSHDEPG